MVVVVVVVVVVGAFSEALSDAFTEALRSRVLLSVSVRVLNAEW